MGKKLGEIGNLLLKLIKYIEIGDDSPQRGMKYDIVHYIEQLTSEPRLKIRKISKMLKDKLISHPAIMGAASDKTIDAELQSLLCIDRNWKKIQKLSPEKAGQQILDRIIESKSPRLVIFPLQGFLPDYKGWIFGKSIFGTYKNILNISNTPIYKPPKNDEPYAQAKKHFFDIATNYEKENLNIISVGTIVEACDIKAAIFLAEKHIILCLNMLRLLLPLEHRSLIHPRLSISDIASIGKAVVISLTNGIRDLYYGNYSSSLFPFIFHSDSDKYYVKKAIERANLIARKDQCNLSRNEKKVLSAISWAGEGINSIEKDMKVVKCVIALEVLFQIKNKNIKKQFIEGVTVLFQHKKVNISKIKEIAGEIYDMRSAIVHRGKQQISDELANWAERLACGCLLRTLENWPNTEI